MLQFFGESFAFSVRNVDVRCQFTLLRVYLCIKQCSFSFDFLVSVSVVIFRIFNSFHFSFSFHDFSVLVSISVKLRVIFQLF